MAFIFSPSTTIVAAVCVLTPWVDERFLLLLPAAAGVRWVLYPNRRRQLWALAAVAPYAAARVSAVVLGDDSVSTQVALQTVRTPDEVRYLVTYLPLGIMEGFRAGWAVLLTGAAVLWTRCSGQAERTGLLATAVLGLGTTYFLAWDSSRSTAVLFPLLVLGSSDGRIRRWLPLLAAINLILPAAHVYGFAVKPLHSILASQRGLAMLLLFVIAPFFPT